MIHVLFVDDDKVTLKLVKEILESKGYLVTTIADPRDAYERMDVENFDMIITDANMPGGVSGYDLVRTIRRTPKLAKLPVAMLTGRRDVKDIQLGLEAGADDYILKPIDPHILLGKVEVLLKKRPGDFSQTTFPEAPVRQKAIWNLDLEVTYISERGLVISSPVPAKEDSKLRIQSEFFSQIGIVPPIMRIVSCSKDPMNPSLFNIKTNFIGLNDNDLQKVRSWIHTKFNPKKAG